MSPRQKNDSGIPEYGTNRPSSNPGLPEHTGPQDAEESPGLDHRRINVEFSGEAYQLLQKLAETTDRTMFDVLRDALVREEWFCDTKQSGAKVLIEELDGTMCEVEFE